MDGAPVKIAMSVIRTALINAGRSIPSQVAFCLSRDDVTEDADGKKL
jgi:hypothetical protein